MKAAEAQHESKVRLLDAALQVIRTKGYSATRIEDVCDAAKLTKGSFFHHFDSNEELALAAAGHFAAMADVLFATAPYQRAADPLERLLGYVDFRIAILQGSLPEFTCLLGTMVQETYETHPAIRAACDQAMSSHIAVLTRYVEAAKKRYAPRASWSPESVGYFIQGVLQGSFILAKAKQSPKVARGNLDHLRCYLKFLFNHPALDLRRRSRCDHVLYQGVQCRRSVALARSEGQTDARDASGRQLGAHADGRVSRMGRVRAEIPERLPGHGPPLRGERRRSGGASRFRRRKDHDARPGDGMGVPVCPGGTSAPAPLVRGDTHARFEPGGDSRGDG